MSCNGCGGVGYDPYASVRNGGVKFMGTGSLEGVIKSEQRIKDEEKAVKKAEKEAAKLEKEKAEGSSVTE